MNRDRSRKPPDRLSRLKALAGLEPDDENLLRELGEKLGDRRDDLVDRFVRQIESFEDLAPMVRDEKRLASIRQSQRSYLDLLFGGTYDGEFLDRRMRLASKLGALRPPSRWFPGGYSVYFETIPPLVRELYREDRERGDRVTAAVWKIFLFDAEIICHTCLGQTIESVQEQRDELKAIIDDRTRALRFSEERYHNLIENYPEMILAVNEGGQVVDANRAVLEELGYDEVEIRELTLHHLIAESHHPRIRMHLERVVRDGHDRVEGHLVTRKGEEKHVELVSSSVRDEEERYLGARIFIRDTMDRRRVEEEMIRWERLVAVGSMAAKVAHEIRNPLSSISLNVELLLDEIRRISKSDSDEAASLVSSILSEIDRLTNVIEDYLKFGRLPSPSLEPVSPEPFLRSIAEFVRPVLVEGGIDLSIEVRPGTPPFPADKNQVRQGVLNLFRNAQEAMQSGGSIRVVAGVREGNVVIEVRDTGIGIPKEEVRKIFDPFYTTKDYGTGLGLAFVQQVMREHGGRVTCRCEPDEGTVFCLHFPAGRE